MPARVVLVSPPRAPDSLALYNRVKEEAYPMHANPAFEQGYPDRATVHRGLQYRLSAPSSASNIGRYFERVSFIDSNGSKCRSFKYVSRALSGAQMADIRREVGTLGDLREKPRPQTRTTRPIGQGVFTYRTIALPPSSIVLVVAGVLAAAPVLLAAGCVTSSFNILTSVVTAAACVVVARIDPRLRADGRLPDPHSAKSPDIEVFSGAYQKSRTRGGDSPDIEVSSGAYVRGPGRDVTAPLLMPTRRRERSASPCAMAQKRRLQNGKRERSLEDDCETPPAKRLRQGSWTSGF
ncbi:hypothetical protein K488DRAFT_91088 [Vararia minispora EC-137]|uniref:Uncharacterized protein n=1 Tax=Vararia minispora EC-137 TaxID=1314806 RepID=A0ACB8Q661_9AGAM|nr:hypothetical protein K488DRAFT_91088 [Vararia minispora EC-137]